MDMEQNVMLTADQETPDINFSEEMQDVDIDDLDEPDQYVEEPEEDGEQDGEIATGWIRIYIYTDISLFIFFVNRTQIQNEY